MGRRFLWKRHSYMRLDGRPANTSTAAATTTTTTGGSCVYGLLQFLNYHHHHWHNAKRVLPHKKHHNNGHPAAAAGGGNADHPVHHHRQEEEIGHQLVVDDLKTEERSNSVNESAVPRRTSSSRSKRSIKSRIKAAFISDKDSSSSTSSSSSKSKRVGSVTDEQPPSSNSHQEEFGTSNSDKSDNKYYASANEHGPDILEVFKVNKQIFLKILSDDRDIAAIHSLDSSQKKNRAIFSLTKSGSFPAPNSNSNLRSKRTTTPSKLEHKQKEVWPQVKGIDIETLILDPPSADSNDNRSSNSHRRAASSLNNDMEADRYAQLFDAILKKEMRKSLSSRSLKLGSDGEPLLSSRSLKLGSEGELTDHAMTRTRTLRRRLSAPDIDYYSFLPGIIDAAGAGRKSDARKSNARNSDAEQSGELAGIINSTKAKGSGEVANDACEEVNLYNMKDRGSGVNLSTEQLISKEDVDNRCCDNEEAVGSFQSPDSDDDQMGNDESTAPAIEGPPDQSTCTTATIDNAKELETTHNQISVNEIYKEDFSYVKYLLENLLGVTTRDQLAALTWHSYDQPLSPSLFEQIETRYSSPSTEPKSFCSSIKTFDDAVNTRQLLFDLVNRALVDIDEKSCVNYPTALSYSCHVQPVSKGRRNRVLDEVWASVVQCLEWKVESNASLDVIVGKDLYSSNDGWMNLQMESECVGLELEDKILDDILDDIILSCYCQ